jgi:type III restriction enzyme
MDYPLARAMADGYVKEPAVVTQRGFDPGRHTPEEIEKIKLEDGVRLHEATKVELTTYARQEGAKQVKPFVLVIARDTTHASQLLALIRSEAFFGGRYQDKVIQVDSSKTGKDEEEMIARLLAVESPTEPTETAGPGRPGQGRGRGPVVPTRHRVCRRQRRQALAIPAGAPR